MAIAASFCEILIYAPTELVNKTSQAFVFDPISFLASYRLGEPDTATSYVSIVREDILHGISLKQQENLRHAVINGHPAAVFGA